MYDIRHVEVVIAALFHDLGKITQRGKVDDCLTPEMEGQLLPLSKDKRYTHKHAWYTHGAVLQLRSCLPEGVNAERVARLAAVHHNPGTWEEWIIAHADRISSGADRTPKELDAEASASYIEQPALSVFSSVILDGSGNPKPKYNRLEPLSASASRPSDFFRNDSAAYKQIWEGLKKDLLAIRMTDLDSWFAAVDAALEHWTWSVPSTTIDQPDISLYDHLRTTTAFASALYLYMTNSDVNPEAMDAHLKQPKTHPFLMVTGDISGIQNYIFDIKTAKGSAKMLRARSFLVKALSGSAARSMERRFGATRFAELSNAGGRFTLVLPALSKGLDMVTAARTELETESIRRFFGQLGVIVSAPLPVSISDLMQAQYSATASALQRLAQEAKLKKFQAGLAQTGHIIGHEYEAMTRGLEGGVAVCPSCELRPTADNRAVCRVCDELHNAGTDLPRTQCIAITREDLGRRYLTLLDGERLYLYDSLTKVPAKDAIVQSTNDYVSGYGYEKLPYIVALDSNGDIMEFAQLAEAATGSKHLAMFKADLDNLGAIFSIGLGTHASISRYASLSRTLDYFFGHIVRAVLASGDENRFIYSVFSGGDDLCVLGPWNNVLDFAVKIHQLFDEYTGHNRFLTLSAGVALAGAGLPVGRIADEAEDALEASKNVRGKASITIFGETVLWPEFEKMLQHGNVLAADLGSGAASTALVYSMIDNSKRAVAFERGVINKENSLWKSHFEYMMKRTKASTQTVSILREYAVNTKSMRRARIPASFALYMNRRGGKM